VVEGTSKATQLWLNIPCVTIRFQDPIAD